MSTLAELRENVSLELGLDQTASSDEETLLTRRLNQGVVEVLKKTHCYVKTAAFALSADTDEYEAPADLLATKSFIDSGNIPLDRVSVEEIHDLRRGTPATGSSSISKYALNGANLFMFYPTPTANGTLTLYYVPAPANPMDSADDDPSSVTYGNVPVDYHDLIEYWACYRMAMYDDDTSSQVGQVYLQLFNQGVAAARAEIQRRGGRKLGPVRIPRRNRIDRDPSRT